MKAEILYTAYCYAVYKSMVKVMERVRASMREKLRREGVRLREGGVTTT